MITLVEFGLFSQTQPTTHLRIVGCGKYIFTRSFKQTLVIFSVAARQTAGVEPGPGLAASGPAETPRPGRA